MKINMSRDITTKVHLIMPMGGGGTRFGNNGFNLPKPLIELQGHPFFFWATQSILKYVDVEDVIFVVLQEHIDKFEIDKRILEYYPTAKVQVIPQVLNGSVLTCCEGIKAVTDNGAILFNDCDHAFICNSFYDYCRIGVFDKIDGALLTFHSDSPNYSYVKFDDYRNVAGTMEKVVVSNEAICGAYYFKNKAIFSESVATYLEKCAYSEYFVSGVYNEMAAKKQKIITFPTDVHIPFGTPDEYAVAAKDERFGAFI